MSAEIKVLTTTIPRKSAVKRKAVWQQVYWIKTASVGVKW